MPMSRISSPARLPVADTPSAAPRTLGQGSFPTGTGSLALCRTLTSNGSGRLACCRVPQLFHPRGICLSEAGRHSSMRRALSEACPLWHPRGNTTTAGSYNTWPHSSRQCLGGPQMRQDPHHSEVDEELIPTAIVIKNACAHRQSPRAQTLSLCTRSWSRCPAPEGEWDLVSGLKSLRYDQIGVFLGSGWQRTTAKVRKGGKGMVKAPFTLPTSLRLAVFLPWHVKTAVSKRTATADNRSRAECPVPQIS
jgi:hypothetical protein